MTPKRVFTLFLCAIILLYILFGFNYLNNNRVGYDEIQRDSIDLPWKGVITIWDYPRYDTTTGLRFNHIVPVIKKFEKEHPGVYIEFKQLNWNDGYTKLLAASKIKALPDIAPIGADYYFQSGNFLEALNNYIDKTELDDFVSKSLETVSNDGNIYGMPWMMTGYTMLINKDLFKEKGIELPQDGNWTYNEFIEAVKQLTYDTNGKGGPDVFGFNAYVGARSYSVFGILLCDGARLFDDKSNRYTFYCPKAISGMTKLYDLKYKHKVTPLNFGLMSESEVLDGFIKGKTAVIAVSSSKVEYIRSLQSDKIDFTVANFPVGESEMPFTVGPCVNAYAVTRQEDPKKRELCVDFIKMMTCQEKQKELSKYGYFTVRKSCSDLYKNDYEMSIINESLSYLEPLPRVSNWYEIDLVLQQKILSLLNGEITPLQAILDSKTQIQNFIK